MWGKGSKEYSERVVRSRVCKYRNQNDILYPRAIASRHKFGRRVTDMGAFGTMIQNMIFNYGKPSIVNVIQYAFYDVNSKIIVTINYFMSVP